LGKIAGDKVHACIHEGRYESDVSGKAIKLSNDQRRSMNPTRGQCFRELWPIRFGAAFDLQKLGYGLPTVQVSLDRLPLGLNAEAAAALSSGRNAEIRNKTVAG
jgi:hypothetical protein